MKRFGHLPMPNLAYQDQVFMESTAARPLRIMAEYIDPINRLRRAGVGDTIVMFGSARIQPPHALAQPKKSAKRRPWPSHPGMEYQNRRGEIHRGNVTLLRRGARAFTPHHSVGDDVGGAAEAFRDLLGRRTRNHGGGTIAAQPKPADRPSA